MYFPIATITNYHKHSGLNNTNLINLLSSGSQKSKIGSYRAKIKVLGLHFFWKLLGIISSLPFPVSGGYFLADGPLPVTEPLQHLPLPSSSSLTLTFLPLSYKDPCYNIEHTQII